MTTLKQEIKDLYNDLRELEWKVKTTKKNIQEKQDKLQSVCDHKEILIVMIIKLTTPAKSVICIVNNRSAMYYTAVILIDV